MTLQVRTIEEIKEELKRHQMARHPYLRDYSPYSVLSTLNETFAIQAQYIEQRAKEAIEANSVLTATGLDLDRLVADRGIVRQKGTHATGEVMFRSAGVALSDIVIPAGTVMSATGPDGSKIFFETLEDGIMAAGDTSVTVQAHAVNPGSQGNVPELSINVMTSYVPGVASVDNPSPFTGGTDEESDEDLRLRYIYATEILGRATKQILEQRVKDLETVRECRSFQRIPGAIEFVVDTEKGTTKDMDVVNCIEENLALGIVSQGKVVATINNGVITPEIGVVYAGKLFVRVEDDIISDGDSLSIIYTNTADTEDRVATVTIPAGATKGDTFEMSMQDNDFARVVTGCLYQGDKNYTILAGLGNYPYLYILPRKVTVSVIIKIKPTDTPDPELRNKIQESVRAYLDDFRIGVDLEFSDLLEYIYTDYRTADTTRDRFVGIDQIVSVMISGKNQTIYAFGQVIDIDDDERIDPGTITVEYV